MPASAAFRVAFSRAGSLMFRHVDSDGRHLFAEPARSGCRLTVETVASRRRLSACLVPAQTASAIDRAIARQAGVDLDRRAIMRVEVAGGGMATHEECKELARACVSAAAALDLSVLGHAA